MALFFDADWFREKLEEVGRTHAELAAAAGLTLTELAAVWKDQKEVTAEMVEAFAEVLESDLSDVARRCGIATPYRDGAPAKPTVGALEEKLNEALRRLDRLEAEVAVLKAEARASTDKEET